VGRPLVTDDDLCDHVRAHLRGSNTPERIEIWDKVPRTGTGKLMRRLAVERFTTPCRQNLSAGAVAQQAFLDHRCEQLA